MRRAVLILVVLAALAGPLDTGLIDRVLTFERHWDVFIRGLFGCPLGVATTPEMCRPALGTIKYREFKLSREAAKRLFQLQD